MIDFLQVLLRDRCDIANRDFRLLKAQLFQSLAELGDDSVYISPKLTSSESLCHEIVSAHAARIELGVVIAESCMRLD